MPNEDSLSSEFVDLKKDVRELLNLVRILSTFVLMPSPGTEEEKKTAMEFKNRLEAMLDKHPKPHGLLKPMHATEGKILELPKEQ
jgi:hypothetical protein